ncbi:F390 synthetase-related protein [Acinetobacter sp. MD2(2019)]|uniref:F390 synthetase-related protein n=1 Tax=Acinetobacter sp. MD2(2019) TaxID=2605273 RepID=UPI002D1EBF24|nr:F390 synthetase-related protein [Acinetobacter sp. MD2(2019)]MEB3753156.1 CoF synthetase [Acinetobacter sp. MD2(2019)]
MKRLKTLWYYWTSTKRKFKSRDALEQFQQQQFSTFKTQVLRQSPYFRQFLHLPLAEWPHMDKPLMMQHFDAMNTAGLKKDRLFRCALDSERSKDFSPKVGKYSVGLSSGTSGQRGLFVVSPEEQQLWAGSILAKLLPNGLFAKERIALFLRADNHLYQSVNSYWLSLNFFGLFENFQQQLAKLSAYQPTIIVAPAQVLTAMAKEKLAGRLNISPKKVISAAEVLDAQDRAILAQAFDQIGEVYQATEGFLAATCAHGTLHLNEESLIVEAEWLDEHRFIPIITDFSRKTQPIVRYRLDDILLRDPTPCLCGSHSMAIAAIEGRQDDQILLKDASGKEMTIFADYCSRIIAQTLPLDSDYRLIQKEQNVFELIACCEQVALMACTENLSQYFKTQGANIENLSWQTTSVSDIPNDFTLKRRRIIRQRWTCE